jgi:hypothetical protein
MKHILFLFPFIGFLHRFLSTVVTQTKGKRRIKRMKMHLNEVSSGSYLMRKFKRLRVEESSMKWGKSWSLIEEIEEKWRRLFPCPNVSKFVWRSTASLRPNHRSNHRSDLQRLSNKIWSTAIAATNSVIPNLYLYFCTPLRSIVKPTIS